MDFPDLLHENTHDETGNARKKKKEEKKREEKKKKTHTHTHTQKQTHLQSQLPTAHLLISNFVTDFLGDVWTCLSCDYKLAGPSSVN